MSVKYVIKDLTTGIHVQGNVFVGRGNLLKWILVPSI